MRTVLLSATLAALLPLPAAAQKVCDSDNASVTWRFLGTATSWFCLERTTTVPMVVTGIEYALRFTTATTAEMGIWSKDPTTGKPLALLGSGIAPVTPNVGGIYTAAMSAPIVVPPGPFFVGVKMPGSPNAVSIATTGTVTPHYWNPPAWNGPFSTGAWTFRIHCGSHQGAYTNYGTAKAGTPGTPVLRGLGFPNTGNPVTWQLSNGVSAGTGILALGIRTPVGVPLPPIGTIYVMPILVALNVPLSGTIDPGSLNVDFTLPNNAALVGQKFALLAVLLDAGAAGGASHTDGLEMLIGG